MHWTLVFLLGHGIAAAAAGNVQVPLGDKRENKYNLTLNFDDLPTNASGIGFHPSPSNASFSYGEFFLESFTVKNVATALPDLDSPMDVLCASSAPNALFASRKAGYPWPHVSLHNLALSPDHPRSKATLNLHSLMISPTGIIKSDAKNSFVRLGITMLKLPPDDVSREPFFPGIERGEPLTDPGRHVFQLYAFFGEGEHQSIRIDFDVFKKWVEGFAEGVDTMEFTAELLVLKDEQKGWELAGDWEFCLDDIKLEVVKAEHCRQDFASRDVGDHIVHLRSLGNGLVEDATELGEEILRDLGRA